MWIVQIEARPDKYWRLNLGSNEQYSRPFFRSFGMRSRERVRHNWS